MKAVAFMVKWICRETCDFFRDQFTLLAITSLTLKLLLLQLPYAVYK